MPEQEPPQLSFRDHLTPGDPGAIRALIHLTGVFSADEADVAGRLAESTLDGSVPYLWCLAEIGKKLVGYTCFDRIELTEGGFDLYWIAVAPDLAGCGIGRELVQRTVAAAKLLGGSQLFAETSSRPPYAAARAFYRVLSFDEVAVIDDFYAAGDAKIIFRQRFSRLAND